jgi:hypothetical protein
MGKRPIDRSRVLHRYVASKAALVTTTTAFLFVTLALLAVAVPTRAHADPLLHYSQGGGAVEPGEPIQLDSSDLTLKGPSSGQVVECDTNALQGTLAENSSPANVEIEGGEFTGSEEPGGTACATNFPDLTSVVEKLGALPWCTGIGVNKGQHWLAKPCEKTEKTALHMSFYAYGSEALGSCNYTANPEGRLEGTYANTPDATLAAKYGSLVFKLQEEGSVENCEPALEVAGDFALTSEGKPLQIGAHVPATTTEAATAVKDTHATLNATVNPRGLATSYYFEYGKTTSYGTKVPTSPASAGSGTTNVAVSQIPTELSESTTYHYRVVASNSEGRTYGADKTFTTHEFEWGEPVTLKQGAAKLEVGTTLKFKGNAYFKIYWETWGCPGELTGKVTENPGATVEITESQFGLGKYNRCPWYEEITYEPVISPGRMFKVQQTVFTGVSKFNEVPVRFDFYNSKPEKVAECETLLYSEGNWHLGTSEVFMEGNSLLTGGAESCPSEIPTTFEFFVTTLGGNPVTAN